LLANFFVFFEGEILMDLVAENIDGVVVLNLDSICNGGPSVSGIINHQTCKQCADISGLIHNWLVSVETKYVLFDLQDEKEICSTFLIEVMQLRKRLKIPFIFAGAMSKSKEVLEAYSYSAEGLPFFDTPEEAVRYLKRTYKDLSKAAHNNVQFGEKILSMRARQLQRMGEDDGVADSELDA